MTAKFYSTFNFQKTTTPKPQPTNRPLVERLATESGERASLQT